MLSFLALGFLIGLRHALEADHVAAVVSLATRGGTMRDHASQGALWGLGHTLTLLILAGGCTLLGVAIPEVAERAFEGAVGVMLVLLGASVFLEVRRRGIHFHSHRHAAHPHAGARAHFHAHAHSHEIDHVDDAHEHSHRRPPLRAFLVGAVHGLAGSAALVLLTTHAARSPWIGLLYVGIFGMGSVVGMMALAVTIALPLRVSARRLTSLYRVLCAGVGTFSMILGGKMIWAFLS